MLPPSCAIIWGFRQKPGCRKPTFMSVFYLDILGPIMASVLQRTILGRICLLISEEKWNHLPNISSTHNFLRGRKAENMNISFTWAVITWAVSARNIFATRTELCPAVPPHLRQPWVRTAEALPLRAEAEHTELLGEPHPRVLHENACQGGTILF